MTTDHRDASQRRLDVRADEVPEIDVRAKWPDHGVEVEISFVIKNGKYTLVRFHEVNGVVLVDDLKKETI